MLVAAETQMSENEVDVEVLEVENSALNAKLNARDRKIKTLYKLEGTDEGIEGRQAGERRLHRRPQGKGAPALMSF